MFRGLILYAQFFTRIPIPIPIDEPEKRFRTNIHYFTLFGAVLGAIECLLFWGYTYLFPWWFAWILLWISDGVITGGFHLDALADTADGVLSSRKPEKMFQIMKDSRLGTMGTLALFYFYALTFGLGAILTTQLNRLQLVGLVLVSIMMAKTGLSILFYKMVYAGDTPGLASIWQGIKTWQILVGQLVSIIIIGLLTGIPGLISYVVVLLVAFIYRRYMINLLGGFSGDTLGGFAEIAQVFFLLSEAVILKFW